MGITVRAIDKDSALNDVVIGSVQMGSATGGMVISAGVVVPHACHLNKVLITVECTAAIATATNYYTMTVTNATKSATLIDHIIPVIATSQGDGTFLTATADSLISAGSLVKFNVCAVGSGTITNLYVVGLGRYDRAER